MVKCEHRGNKNKSIPRSMIQKWGIMLVTCFTGTENRMLCRVLSLHDCQIVSILLDIKSNVSILLASSSKNTAYKTFEFYSYAKTCI